MAPYSVLFTSPIINCAIKLDVHHIEKVGIPHYTFTSRP